MGYDAVRVHSAFNSHHGRCRGGKVAVLAIHEALDRLTAQAPLKAEVVKMRYFIGLHHGEIARALGLSEATVRRHWSFARAWLYAELKVQLQE